MNTDSRDYLLDVALTAIMRLPAQIALRHEVISEDELSEFIMYHLKK